MINFFGLRDNLTEYLELLKECDSDESKEGKVSYYILISEIHFIMISNLQEKVAKGRGIVKEVSEAFKAVNLEETAKQLVQVLSL